jgi:hypothetical protein
LRIIEESAVDNSTDNIGAQAQRSQGPLPQQMVDAKRWILWKEIPNVDPSKKPRKVPCYVDGANREGTLDSPEDIARLGTFEVAVQRFNAGGYAGLGFALGPDGTGNHWQGFDYDNVPSEHVDAAMAELPGYVEASPSGRGCHAIGYGRTFTTLGSNGTNVEAYAGGRFFTVTGDRGRGQPVCIATFVEGPVAAKHGAARTASGAAGTTTLDPVTITELRSALASMRADDYDIWYRMGMALHELGDVGRGLWMEWSATSEKFDPQDAARKWDRDLAGAHSIGYLSVFHEAQARGWVNPRSNAAQGQSKPTIDIDLGKPAKTGQELLDELAFDWDTTPDMEPDVIEGLIADEEVTLLGGHGGGGKGFMALQFDVALALGLPVLGCKVARQYRVLHYSAEDGKKRLGRRLRAYLKNFTPEEQATVKKNLRLVDASELRLLYGEQQIDTRSFAKALTATPDYYNLQKMAEAFDAEVIVVDGASDTFGGNEVSRLQTTEFVKLLKFVHPKRRRAVLLLVHIDRASARGNVTDDDGYSGNSAWHNACRRRVYLQKKTEKGDDQEVISSTTTLRVMKNQDAKEGSVPDMEIIRDENGFWMRPGDFAGAPLLAQAAAAAAQAKPDHGKKLLELIDSYYQRKQWIGVSLAPNSSNGVFATLSGDPTFNSLKMNKKKTHALMRQLVRDGSLEQETYPDAARRGHASSRWKVLKDPQYAAPGSSEASK